MTGLRAHDEGLPDGWEEVQVLRCKGCMNGGEHWMDGWMDGWMVAVVLVVMGSGSAWGTAHAYYRRLVCPFVLAGLSCGAGCRMMQAVYTGGT